MDLAVHDRLAHFDVAIDVTMLCHGERVTQANRALDATFDLDRAVPFDGALNAGL